MSLPAQRTARSHAVIQAVPLQVPGLDVYLCHGSVRHGGDHLDLNAVGHVGDVMNVLGVGQKEPPKFRPDTPAWWGDRHGGAHHRRAQAGGDEGDAQSPAQAASAAGQPDNVSASRASKPSGTGVSSAVAICLSFSSKSVMPAPPSSQSMVRSFSRARLSRDFTVPWGIFRVWAICSTSGPRSRTAPPPSGSPREGEHRLPQLVVLPVLVPRRAAPGRQNRASVRFSAAAAGRS